MSMAGDAPHRQARQPTEQLHLLGNRIAGQRKIRKASENPFESSLGILLCQKGSDACMTKSEAQMTGVVPTADVEVRRRAGVEMPAPHRAAPIELVDRHADRFAALDRERCAA